MSKVQFEQPNMNFRFEIEASNELQVALKLAIRAGEILKKYFKTDLTVQYKKDEFDPVSAADRESDELLREGIATAFPADQILSEENPLKPTSYAGRVWMVDPLDDTKGYLAGRDTAGVMIGLLEAGKPKMGLVYLPFRNEFYYGEVGKGSFRVKNEQSTQLKVPDVTDIRSACLVVRHVITGDERPIEEAIAKFGFASTIAEGCMGAKIGLIAAGEAEAFINTNIHASKWDTLAAQVILSEAGGVICDVYEASLDYTKSSSVWEHYFMAACTPQLLNEMASKLRQANVRAHYF